VTDVLLSGGKSSLSSFFFCERVLNPLCYYLRPFWDKTYEFLLNPLVDIIELLGPGDECTQYLRMQQPNTPGHTDLLRPFQIT
jgi:hypothetical protein